MGAEALLRLGVDPASVSSWVERHQPQPLPADSPVAIGRAVIAEELATADWRQVAQRHVEQLIGRLDVHLFHGLIRTAHAVRALEIHEDQAGRDELAMALAAWRQWAGADAQVPWRSPAPASSTPVVEGAVLEAARRGAVAFVAKPTIVTIHAVTAPMAYLLLGYLCDPSGQQRAAEVFSRTHQAYPDELGQAPPRTLQRPTPAQLQPLAQRWDAHPAKLVEAALRGYDSSGEVVFLQAIAVMLEG
jgi:DNA-binding transcriptional regulator YdaS (Cro superfamily)